MSNPTAYLREYAQMILDKHGKAPLAELGAQGLQALVASELAPFAPETGEVVSVALELGGMVGDMAIPYIPPRKRGREAMFR